MNDLLDYNLTTMGGDGDEVAVDKGIQRIVQSLGFSKIKRLIPHNYRWQFPMNPAGSGGIEVNIANQLQFQSQYTLLGQTIMEGYHHPRYIGAEGRSDGAFASILQECWLEWDLKIWDELKSVFLGQPAKIVITTAATENYVIPLDGLCGGNTFENGHFYMPNQAPAAQISNSLETYGTQSYLGNQQSDNGGRFPLYLNKDLPGLGIAPNISVTIKLFLQSGWSATLFPVTGFPAPWDTSATPQIWPFLAFVCKGVAVVPY